MKQYFIRAPGTLEPIFGNNPQELEDKYFEGFNPVFECQYWKSSKYSYGPTDQVKQASKKEVISILEKFVEWLK